MQALREKEEELQRQAEEIERKRLEEEKRLRDEKFKAQQEAYARAQAESQRAQQEEQLRAQQEAQMRAQQEAQMRAQQEEQLRAQQEAQLRAQQEEQLRAQQEAQLRAQQEEQLRAQQEAQLRAQQEELRRQQQEAQYTAQQEEIRRQQEELRRQQQEIASGVGFGAGFGAGFSGSMADDMGGFGTTGAGVNSIHQDSNFGSGARINEGEEPTSYTGRVLQVPHDYKKVVAIIGTNKIGTSFMANSVGTLLALKGVKVSILDMTRNRGLYWYYSDDTYKRTDVIASCMSNLSNGVANPVQVGKVKNLSLYTTIPKGREDNRKGYKHRTVIETAKRNCNLLIIDCDFTTPFEYLELADDIYIVQDLDLVKCRETVEYLRILKDRRIDWDKLRLIINNSLRCRVTPKRIRRDALTLYVDPNLTFNDEIEEIRKFVEIPMDPLNYATYIEGMEHGKLEYEKYTESLKSSLETLSKMVYGIPSRRKGLFGG